MHTIKWEAVFRKRESRTDFITVDFSVTVPDYSFGRMAIASIVRLYALAGYELSEVVYKSMKEVRHGKETGNGY
jgi:hypothetical protein